MASGLPPVSKEQAFLEAYFQCLNNFAFEKAKEKAEKEKEFHKSSPTSPVWLTLVSSLSQLAQSEKEYNSLMFLGHKLLVFGRKDSLKHTYTYLQNEFKKIEENTLKAAKTSSSNSSSSCSPGVSWEELLGHLCGQLCHYVIARMKTMEFLEQLATTHFKNLIYEDLLAILTAIIQTYHKSFHHPILSPLKSNFTQECDILSNLLQAQIQIQHCQFLPCLLLLNEAHSKITTWGSVVTQKEIKTGLFGSVKHPPVPALYQWLVKFKAILVSKFTLYFYDVLCKQGPAAELKTFTSRASVDFYSKVVHFHKKCDAYCSTLVFDTNNLDEKYRYKGPGYHHPSTVAPSLTGLESYPAVFTYPGERADKHWPAIISIMTDRTLELHTSDKFGYFCDDKIQSTYFLTRIDPRMTYVIIFECAGYHRNKKHTSLS